MKDKHIPMFIVTSFTKAQIWKQPKCPLIDRSIKRMWRVYTYTLIYTVGFYSAMRKRDIQPFKIIMLST